VQRGADDRRRPRSRVQHEQDEERLDVPGQPAGEPRGELPHLLWRHLAVRLEATTALVIDPPDTDEAVTTRRWSPASTR
jgi:hypothetical protein